MKDAKAKVDDRSSDFMAASIEMNDFSTEDSHIKRRLSREQQLRRKSICRIFEACEVSPGRYATFEIGIEES